jgi:hypothetical protein
MLDREKQANIEKSEIRKKLEDLKEKNKLAKKIIDEIIKERSQKGKAFVQEAHEKLAQLDELLIITLKSIDFDKHHPNAKQTQKNMYLESKNV